MPRLQPAHRGQHLLNLGLYGHIFWLSEQEAVRYSIWHHIFLFSFFKCSCLFKTSVYYAQSSSGRNCFVFFWPNLSPYIIVTILSGKDLWMLRLDHPLFCVLIWQGPLETSPSHTSLVFSAHLLCLLGLSDTTPGFISSFHTLC